MSVNAAIERAKATLHFAPVDEGRDPRWQAIIDVSEYLESDPEPIWGFIKELHDTPDDDLLAALATCLLEHLFEYHPDYRTKAKHLAEGSPAVPRDVKYVLLLMWDRNRYAFQRRLSFLVLSFV